MPKYDGTGPQGQGAMTVRRRGRCLDTQITQTRNTETQSAENKEVIYGLGRGGRPRGGSGFANCFGAAGKGQGRCRGFGNK